MVLLYGNQPKTGKKKDAGGNSTYACLFLVVYSALFLVLTSGLIPPDVLWSMQAANVPIILTGKVISLFVLPKHHDKSLSRFILRLFKVVLKFYQQ